MSNGLPGTATTETITGGKTIELTEYDRHRKPHKMIEDDTIVKITPRTLSSESTCAICLDLYTATMGTKECLHRFCSECINTALLRNNKECPTCRKKIVSKRSLRYDTNMDSLLGKIWTERRVYEEMEAEAAKKSNLQDGMGALQRSIMAGIRAQAQNRRQRVQGSYDYEKRKRKRRVPEGEQPEHTAPCSPTEESSTTAAEEVEAVHDINLANDVDGSYTGDSSLSDLSSELSSAFTDSSDLDSLSSEEDNCPLSNDRNTNHNQNSALPSLENMTSVSGGEESTYETTERSTQLATLKKYQEVEVELSPTKSMRHRPDIVSPLRRTRYIRTHRNASVEHLSAFLIQAARADMMKNDVDDSASQDSALPCPSHFYGLDSENKIYPLTMNDTLQDAHLHGPLSEEHLKLYFDIVAHNENKLHEEILGRSFSKRSSTMEDRDKD